MKLQGFGALKLACTRVPLRCPLGANWSTWEGHGDLVSRLILGIVGDTIWLIGVINLLTS